MYSPELQSYIREELADILNFFEYGSFEREPKYLKVEDKNCYGISKKESNKKTIRELSKASLEEIQKRKIIYNQEKELVFDYYISDALFLNLKLKTV